jgi:hypothetical protein
MFEILNTQLRLILARNIEVMVKRKEQGMRLMLANA